MMLMITQYVSYFQEHTKNVYTGNQKLSSQKQQELLEKYTTDFSEIW